MDGAEVVEATVGMADAILSTAEPSREQLSSSSTSPSSSTGEDKKERGMKEIEEDTIN